MLKKICCLLTALLVSGCANHMRLEVLNDLQIIRTEPDLKYFIKTEDVATDAIIRVNLEQLEKIKVITSEDITERDVYTPYSGFREIYEFPCGILLLPAALVINVLNVGTFGSIPDNICDKPILLSFTGLNPFLNWESEVRAEKDVLKTYKKVIDEEEEIKRVPSCNTELTVLAAELEDQKFTTDSKGLAEISLLSQAFLNKVSDIKDLTVTVGNMASGGAEKNIIVDRKLRLRIEAARQVIFKYNKEQTVSALVDAVLSLEGLGFKRTALEFERYHIGKHGVFFKEAFEKEIDEKAKF